MKNDNKQAGKPALKLMVGAVAGASVLGMVSAAQAQETLNIVSWGGAYTASQQKAYHEPWMEQTGDEIINIDRSGNALAGLRAQTQAGNVTWDLVDMLPADAMIACAAYRTAGSR